MYSFLLQYLWHLKSYSNLGTVVKGFIIAHRFSLAAYIYKAYDNVPHGVHRWSIWKAFSEQTKTTSTTYIKTIRNLLQHELLTSFRPTVRLSSMCLVYFTRSPCSFLLILLHVIDKNVNTCREWRPYSGMRWRKRVPVCLNNAHQLAGCQVSHTGNWHYSYTFKKRT